MDEQPVMDVTSDDKLWAALSYVFAPLIGIIVLLMQDKKTRPFIRFHAVQSIAVSVVFWILATVVTTVTLGFGGLCVPLVWLVFLYWGYKAYQGEMINIPFVTNLIKNQGWA
ncbi:MAG: DUF4870 domain-containing protein [Syntrophothermus sp.]